MRNKNNGDARDEDRNHKMLPVSSCMSIYSKRATIACHGFLRGQEFSLEHMIDCIIGHDMYLLVHMRTRVENEKVEDP